MSSVIPLFLEMEEKVGDTHTRDRWQWLEQVQADECLTPFAFQVAFVILSHVNRKTGDAWPSQATIAQKTRSTERGVRKAIDQLVERGHLSSATPAGRKGGNHYRIVLQNRAETNDFHRNVGSYENGLNRNGGSGENASYRNPRSSLTGTPVPPNPMKEPLENNLSSPETKKRARKPKMDGEHPDFEEAYAAYPKHVGRDEASTAYSKAIASGISPSEILSGVRRYVTERTGQDPKYTKNFQGWLSGKRWKDGQSGSAPIGETFEFRGIPIPADRIREAGTMYRTKGIWPQGWEAPPGSPACAFPERLLFGTSSA